MQRFEFWFFLTLGLFISLAVLKTYAVELPYSQTFNSKTSTSTLTEFSDNKISLQSKQISNYESLIASYQKTLKRCLGK